MRVITPCPKIDYKIEINPANPDLDPGIHPYSSSNPIKVIPGPIEQPCDDIFPANYQAESNAR